MFLNPGIFDQRTHDPSARAKSPIAELAKNTRLRNFTRTSNIMIDVFGEPKDWRGTSTNTVRANAPEFATLYFNNHWVRSFVDEARNIETSTGLVPYYKEFLELLNNKRFKECDAILSNLSTSNLSDVLLVGLLRLTSSWKHDLKSWPELLLKCSKELENRGFDPDKYLKGLQ